MSIYVTLSNISFSYPSSSFSLFEDLSLSFHEGWTTILGSNGCGKSTLASLIEGSLTPEAGAIEKRGNVVLCSQIFSGIKDEDYALLYDYSSSSSALRRKLGLDEDMFLHADELSGGEKKRLQAYLALSSSPDILIMDEPTNHLDKRNKEYLLNALLEFKGCGIIISHDRAFASALSSRTIIMTNYGDSTPTFFEDIPLPPIDALTLSKEKKTAEREERANLSREIKRMASSEKALRAKAEAASKGLSKSTVGRKDNDAKAKIDLARLTGKDRSVADQRRTIVSRIGQKEKELSSLSGPRMRKEGISSASFSPLLSSFLIEKSTLTAGSLKVEVPQIEVKRGDKLAVTGDNGSGKTLFIKYVCSEYMKKSSSFLYLKQEYDEGDRERLKDTLKGMDDREKGSLLSLMFRLGSNASAFLDGEKNLSSGEMRKLDFLLSINSDCPLLILDEPTNHLDITAVLAMEEILKETRASIILVSHDRLLLSEVCNRELHFEREGDKTTVKEIRITE